MPAAVQDECLAGGPALPGWDSEAEEALRLLDAAIDEAHHIGSMTPADMDRIEEALNHPMFNPVLELRQRGYAGPERRIASRRWHWWRDIWPVAKGVLFPFVVFWTLVGWFLLHVELVGCP